MERIYPKRLTPFWRQVCLRYNREIYNPQLALSLGRKDFMRDGNKDDCEITNFNRFVYFVFGLLYPRRKNAFEIFFVLLIFCLTAISSVLQIR